METGQNPSWEMNFVKPSLAGSSQADVGDNDIFHKGKGKGYKVEITRIAPSFLHPGT
jgi:hypothetical protein